DEVHRIIRANLQRAPMYSGQINSTGPRYCPSIEDKVVRFADKDRHQLFLEPEGRTTHEVYVNGISTSLPRDVQDAVIRHIPGLSCAQIMRYGYAVEYDFCPPQQLNPTLETKRVARLFFAGQINGTTGYEEAAAQGLIAGANAVLTIRRASPFILSRNSSYIGVLIDDLVTCGVDEPYRMFTSRAEYRLLLRQDNADRRLTPIANKIGLVGNSRYQRLLDKEAQIKVAKQILDGHRTAGVTLTKYLRRNEISWKNLVGQFPQLTQFSDDTALQVTYDVKYAGYIDRQKTEIDRQQRLAQKSIPKDFDFTKIDALRKEAKERLSHLRPVSLAQASRISGITPADIALLMVHLDRPRRTAD
ncbi:MAG: FAD-dependent oxidoreductase, partial [Pirellulales bacterium]